MPAKYDRAADKNLQSGARQQCQRRLLQAAFRDAEPKRHCAPPEGTAIVQRDGEARARAGVANYAFAFDLDAAQDGVEIAIGEALMSFRRLPEVSPLVQSWLRVRLKNVT